MGHHRRSGNERDSARDHGGGRWLGSWLLAGLAACSSGGGISGDAGDGGGASRRGGQGEPLQITPVIEVKNDHANARTETIRASVPFPEGMIQDLGNVGVSGIQSSWMPMQQWADGSVRVAQVQFTDTLAANAKKSYDVVKGVTPLQGAFEKNSWVEQLDDGMRFGGWVRDTFGVPYAVVTDGQGGKVLHESYLVRTRRLRGYHKPLNGQTGIGRDYLSSTFYVTEFRDAPVVVVDWILGNDYLGSDNPAGSTNPNLYPLGTIDVREAKFLVKGVTECHPYLPQWHDIEAPQPEGNFESYRVMKDTYIDDAQTRRYRFVLRFEHPNATAAAKQRWRDTVAAMIEEPLYPLADLESWQKTLALGLHGGPIDGPADARQRAVQEYQSWAGRDHFGTWGSFGDAKISSTTGTPRNHPVSPEAAHAIQGGYAKLLQKLEQKAWAQAMRAQHLFGLRVDHRDILLWDCPPVWPGSRDLSSDSLGRRALWANDPYSAYRTMTGPGHTAHGWGWYDHEHWTTDLLFDYWTISGDAWAKEELRQLGEVLKGLMVLKKYNTAHLQAARAEGWTMASFVQTYLATGDESLKNHALDRVHDTVDVQRAKWHPSKALAFQGDYPGTGFGGQSHKFFMPWQHGPVLYGYLAAFEFFGDPLCLEICEDVVTTVEYSWVTNYNDPNFGFVDNGLRYYTPVEYNGQAIPPDYFDQTAGIGVKWGDSPLGGAHGFLTGGLLLLPEYTLDQTVSSKAKFYGNMLLGNLAGGARWYKWNLVVPE